MVGPGGLDPQGSRLRQALVPVPERTWALRNVANSMLRSAAASGDNAAAEEALGMLKQAADLAAEHYGATHPGQQQCGTLLECSANLIAVALQALQDTGGAARSMGCSCLFCVLLCMWSGWQMW